MKPKPTTHVAQDEPEGFRRRKTGNELNQCLTVALFCTGLARGLAATTLPAAEQQSELPLTNVFAEAIPAPGGPTCGVWTNGLGDGFHSNTESVSLEFGTSRGVAILGGHQRHDLALASISYGHMLGCVSGEEHWYRGNWELRGELFGGLQYSPAANYALGIAPHLRYNFATGTRWVPFADVGAGASATGIGAPDLSGTFEFNLQGAVGTHWFIRNNLALTAEARYLHLSCAGMNSPNLGLNGVAGMVGLSWFF